MTALATACSSPPLGAVLLAVSVFLPWYELSLTPDGANFAANLAQGFARQFGNESLQHLVAGLHGNLASASGQQLAPLSAHQALHDLNVVLLVLAGIALLRRARRRWRVARRPPPACRRPHDLARRRARRRLRRLPDVGAPVPAGGLVALTLREGSWLALLGSLMMVLGPIWPRVSLGPAHVDALIRA